MLDTQEIVLGLADKFNIYFSPEQAAEFIAYLDEDNSGDVDFEEFRTKINYDRYQNDYHLYTITFKNFIDILLDEWKRQKELADVVFMEKFQEFDENGDGVLTFEEFENLINNLEKDMSRDDISALFNETLEMDENSTDMDKMNPD